MAPPPREVGIAIVGGGLGGLALAAGLLRRGYDVHVFEGASQLRRETSTMIGLGPNAFAALGEVHPEIPDRLKRRGVFIEETLVRSLPPGGEPQIVRRTGEDIRLCTIRWAETQAALAELVPPEAIHCDHAATGYEEVWEAADGGQQGDEQALGRPASRAVVHFRSQPSVSARLVVGADGVFSAIRAAMHPEDPGPRYLGHMNWNCVFPNPGGNTVVEAHKPAQLVAISDSSMGPNPREMTTLMYVSDAGLDYTFVQVRIQSDEPSFTAVKAPLEGSGQTSNGDSGADGNCGKEQEKGWRRGRGGQGVPGSKERVIGILKSAGWDFAVPVLEAVPESALFERALYDRLPLARWSSRGGRVVLMGDAAHAMHPGPGQGARSAFEDAHQLVLALEALWPDVPAALERYQGARIARANRVQRFAAEGTGLAAIRDAARPAGQSPQDRRERYEEFRRWLDQYPANMGGDPDSKWWQPVKASVAADGPSVDGGSVGGVKDGEPAAVQKP